MPNWTESMQQMFEYYEVDPGTWRDIRKLNNVLKSTITRDSDVETLGSATIDVTGILDECYVRTYLVTIQNGITEKFPIGTFLVQTPTINHDGKVSKNSLDAYTPLLELKENPPPIGYSLLKNENIMDRAYMLCREHMRAPVNETICDTTLHSDFVSNTNDTWLSFVRDLIANAKYEFSIDEMGRLLFSPKQTLAALQPVWTYDDGNSSILYPEISTTHDLYGVPNVVEVVYSNGGTSLYARVVNDDPGSPTSTVSRGREITHRVTQPDILGNPTQAQIQEYAEQLLRDMSSVEYTVTYSHGYCPVRIGDCVRLDYVGADLKDIKAKVIRQSIVCSTSCKVTETAVYTKRLWEG